MRELTSKEMRTVGGAKDEEVVEEIVTTGTRLTTGSSSGFGGIGFGSGFQSMMMDAAVRQGGGDPFGEGEGSEGGSFPEPPPSPEPPIQTPIPEIVVTAPSPGPQPGAQSGITMGASGFHAQTAPGALPSHDPNDQEGPEESPYENLPVEEIVVIGERIKDPGLGFSTDYIKQLMMNSVNLDFSHSFGMPCEDPEVKVLDIITDEQIEDLLSDLSAASRQDGVVYVTSRPVIGSPWHHMAIEFNNETVRETLSAFHSDGSLVSNPDDDSDISDNITVGVVIPPGGISGQQYYDILSAADEVYLDHLNYGALAGEVSISPGFEAALHAIPGMTADIAAALVNFFTGYNSNGYVRGMIEATGGTVVVDLQNGERVAIDWDDYIGGNKPVPPTELGGSNEHCPWQPR